MDYNITYRDKDKGIQAIVSYKEDNGKWKQKSKQGFSKKGEAKTWAQDTIDDLKEKIGYINPEYNGTTFKELFESYTKHIELYKETNTLKNYYGAKPYFIKLFDMEVEKISALNIQECVDEMVKKLSPSTIEAYTSKIKTVFKHAVITRIIKDNPALYITLPKNKKTRKENVKALTKAELKDLLSKIEYPKHHLISMIAATCGLRIGEILGLTWNNINEKNSTMTIDTQWKIIKRDPLTFGFGPVKSKNSNRVIPIPPKTMAELKKYKKKHPTDIKNRVFPYTRTDSVGSMINNMYKKIGYNISIHDLRHTYASTLIANGLDFKTVAELMGHTVNETIETYSHFTKDMLAKATKVVNTSF